MDIKKAVGGITEKCEANKMEYRYEKCPRCGLSNGTDDKILSSKIIDTSYNGGEITILEERKCDICQKVYKVEMHYTLKYEEVRL